MHDLVFSEVRHAAESDSARPRRRGLAVGLVALLPALAAVWSVPWFVTQDGPAHLYNAHIIERSGDEDSPFRHYYDVRWEPIPNWTGHLAMVGLLRLLPPRAADRAMTSLTLAGFAASIVWLRWRVSGWRGMPTAALLAALLALNVTWLLGFTSFLLGACLVPITLGAWWGGRDRLVPWRIATLSALLTLGYFSHLVSLGVTVLGLGVLALWAPGERRWARAGRTAIAMAPLVPLGFVYLFLSRRGGPMKPRWEHLIPPISFGSWFQQLGWVDPISLASKIVFPFREGAAYGWALLAPVLWLAIALVLGGIATLRKGRPEGRRAWGILAALLLVGGLIGPDTLGASHGNYLQQRIVLFGLVALVPFLDLEARGWAGLGCASALALAVAVQSGFVWEYALTSDRTVGEFMAARPEVGEGNRVATLLNQPRGRFRSYPLLHADCLLGIGTGNIIWSNYETRYYYFPVQFKGEVDRPDSATLEWIALNVDPAGAKARLDSWDALLLGHHQDIDRLVVWGDRPEFAEINRFWFEPVSKRKNPQVLRHR